MSRGLVRTRSCACSFTNAVIVRIFSVSLFLYKYCSHIIIARCRGAFAVDLPGKDFVDLEKFVFVVRVEEKVFFEIVVEEIGLLVGSESEVGFTFFESHGSGGKVTSL